MVIQDSSGLGSGKLSYRRWPGATRAAVFIKNLDEAVIIFHKLGICSGPFSVGVYFRSISNPTGRLRGARLFFKNSIFDRVDVFANFSGAFRVGASAYQTLESGSVPTFVRTVT